ncbi:hypothetical protein DFH09DRAFT_1197630 [Mycena vulgaris]|nr:hypothetical protein DFH09DRAFT_1197630 [Mycena vulgaris]
MNPNGKPFNDGDNREFGGGHGGTGGASAGVGGEGGEGKAPEILRRDINGALANRDIHGGHGGSGGNGGKFGGKGGVGYAPRIVQPVHSSDKVEMLPHLEVPEFCKEYRISNKIRSLIEEAGFETAASLCEVTVDNLTGLGFKMGQIAEVQRALRQFSLKNGVETDATIPCDLFCNNMGTRRRDEFLRLHWS